MTPEELLKDPEFHALPDSDKIAIFGQADPEFAKLPSTDQVTIMSGFAKPQAQTATPAPAPSTMDPTAIATDIAKGLYEGSPIPGIVDAAKLASLPFRPSSYEGIGEAAEQSFFSSQGIGGQLGKGAIKTLPMAGALAGGAAGTIAGAGVMSPVLGAAGAGLGYGIGERAQKLLETYFGLYEPKSFTEEMKDTAKAVGTGTKAFMQGESGTKMLTMAGAPLAGQFAKPGPKGDTARLGQQMVEEGGVPLSPDLYAPGKTTKFLQWITDNIIPGGSIIANRRRQVVNDTISQMRQDFVEAAGLPNPFTPLKEAKALKNKAYENFLTEGGSTPIQFPNTLQFIEENINSPGLQTSGVLKDKVVSFRDTLKSNKSITANQSQIDSAYGEFFHNEIFGKYSYPKDKNKMDELTKQFRDSLSSIYTAKVTELNDLLPYIWSRTPSTNKIGKNKNQYQKLTDESINFRNGLKDAIDADLGVHEVDTGSMVLESLNKAREATKDVGNLGKAKYLEKFLENSTTWNPKTQKWDFQAGKFYSDVMKKKELLQNKYPDEFGNIMRFAEKAKLTSGDIARMSSKPAWQQAIEIGIGGGAGAAIYSNPILAVPLGFPAFASYSLMNPSGTLRKLLTTGIKPPTLTKETIKLGVMNEED